MFWDRQGFHLKSFEFDAISKIQRLSETTKILEHNEMIIETHNDKGKRKENFKL